MRGLSDRTYLITGAASGIGKATATRLVDADANVVLVDIDFERVAAVAGGLGAERAIAMEADVTHPGAMEGVVAATLEVFGGLHGVLTSAGIFAPEDLVDLDALDLDVFDRVLSVNLKGTVITLRAALPHLGEGAAIVTVASTAGLRGHGLGPSYTATKGGVIALTRLLAVQYGPRGVRVNCVCPGGTAGEGMGSAFTDPDFAAQMSKQIPLRRVGQASEVGATIAALLSSETSYVTGQVLAIDGGATAV